MIEGAKMHRIYLEKYAKCVAITISTELVSVHDS